MIQKWYIMDAKKKVRSFFVKPVTEYRDYRSLVHYNQAKDDETFGEPTKFGSCRSRPVSQNRSRTSSRSTRSCHLCCCSSRSATGVFRPLYWNRPLS